MPPEARRGLLIGIPVFILAATGIALGSTGDRTGSTALFVAGIICFGVAFLVWMVVVVRLTYLARPEVKAWNQAITNGPTANRFNTVVCSLLLIVGVVATIQEPSAFWVMWLVVVSGMLVVFIRRGWPGAPSSSP